MKTDQLESAASGAAATAAKLGVVWGAVLAGFSEFPWAALAAALASLYSVHLIVGWWLDRLWPPQQPRRGSSKPRRWWRKGAP